jgi:hypothetical protein
MRRASGWSWAFVAVMGLVWPAAAAAQDDAPEEPPKAEEPPAAEPAKAEVDPDGQDEFDLEDAKSAGWAIGDATKDPADGLGVDGKDYELPASTFVGIDEVDPQKLEALTEVTPAEAQLEAQAEALAGFHPRSPSSRSCCSC